MMDSELDKILCIDIEFALCLCFESVFVITHYILKERRALWSSLTNARKPAQAATSNWA